MGKGHRDNHEARKKIGDVAFAKKAKRRNPNQVNCNLCGRKVSKGKVVGGLCPICIGKG